jgi:hypothetical protein
MHHYVGMNAHHRKYVLQATTATCVSQKVEDLGSMFHPVPMSVRLAVMFSPQLQRRLHANFSVVFCVNGEVNLLGMDRVVEDCA